jgi:hypothetical protein
MAKPQGPTWDEHKQCAEALAAVERAFMDAAQRWRRHREIAPRLKKMIRRTATLRRHLDWMSTGKLTIIAMGDHGLIELGPWAFGRDDAEDKPGVHDPCQS